MPRRAPSESPLQRGPAPPGSATAERAAPMSASSLAVAAVLLSLVILAFVVFPPGSRADVSWELTPPFVARDGARYVAQVPSGWPHDGNGTLENSRLRLIEDGTVLGPPHSPLSLISKLGRGRYAHLARGLHFSASDNSNPGANGRRYQVLMARQGPVALHLLATLLAYLLSAFLARGILCRWLPSRGGAWRTAILDYATPLVLVATAFQIACWSVVENRLPAKGKLEQELFHQAFEPSSAGSPRSFRFEPHHYLNYALDPRHRPAGSAVHDPVYRIRRSEALRPRSEVELRVLAIGGSTTYDNALAEEKDTWVFRLERQLRNELGDGVDVVNGGVGGYTIYENLIHYVTHLSHLEPDIVLLYTGINDVHPRLFASLAIDYSNYRRPWRGTTELTSRIYPLLAWLQPFRLWYLEIEIRLATRRNIGSETRGEYPPSGSWEEALQRNSSDLYRSILHQFVSLVRGQGRRVALLPQVFTPKNDRDQIFATGVEEHNLVAATLAAEQRIPYFASITSSQTLTASDTVDNCHFNRGGAAKMARLVAEELRRLGWLKQDQRRQPYQGSATSSLEEPTSTDS